MQKAQAYREQARRCELLLEKVTDLRIRQQLRRERQEWLELAASCEAALRNERWAGERPLDQEMTLAALRALEAGRSAGPDAAPSTPSGSPSPNGGGNSRRQPPCPPPQGQGDREAVEGASPGRDPGRRPRGRRR